MWQDVVMAKRPRDPIQLAKQVFDIAIGEAEDTVSPKKRAASVRGRSGGLKGGKSRAKKLTPAMAAGLSDHVWSLEEIAMLAV
jgi:hypothetical protein